MKKRFSLLFITILLLALTIKAQVEAPLRLVHTTLLPGYVGDFEHFAVDVKGKRLFMAAEDNKSVEVFDLDTSERIHTVSGFKQPHAMVHLPDKDRLIVTDGDDDSGSVLLVSETDYKIIGKIDLPGGVDNAVYNPVNKYYYVEGRKDEAGSKANILHIIDTQNFKHIGDIKLPGSHSEAMAIDKAGAKLYVNLSGANEVGVVDLQTNHLLAEWPIPEAEVENALTLDEFDRRLLTASHKPPKLIVFDLDSGKAIASLPCVINSDDMSYDGARKRVYVTGDGSVSVFQQTSGGSYEHIAEVPTGYRAKTSIFVPEVDRLYIAVASRGKRVAGKMAVPEPGSQVEVQIYEPSGPPSGPSSGRAGRP